LQVPDDEILQSYYAMNWEEEPSTANYTPCFKPNSTYAAMITRMDLYVGRVLDELDRHGLTGNTIVVFTSDNGATYLGPMEEFFNSNAGLRGSKGSMYEGGIRIPMIVKWPGHVKPGTESGYICGFEDWLPTLLDVSGGDSSQIDFSDGLSLRRLFEGGKEPRREYLYREFAGYGGQQAVWIGDWKAVRRNLRKGVLKTELYNLSEDPAENRNVAAEHKMLVAEIEQIMKREHSNSEIFPLEVLDNQ
jgi:arylsulfatase A